MNGEELSDRVMERFAYCLLPCAYCLLAVWARAGIIMGILSETRGAEMYAKGVLLGGFGREKGGQKGAFGASKAGKMVLFCVREGWIAGGEGFSG